jgi:hypothetical protein
LSFSNGVPEGWKETAFQPSCQIPRCPNISKYCGEDFDGATGSAIERAKLSPSIGICATPPISAGGAMPIRSSKVGVRSQA